MKFAKVGSVIVTIILFVTFVWPTKWERWQFSAHNVRIEYKRNRFTGEVFSRRPNDGEIEWTKLRLASAFLYEEEKPRDVMAKFLTANDLVDLEKWIESCLLTPVKSDYLTQVELVQAVWRQRLYDSTWRSKTRTNLLSPEKCATLLLAGNDRIEEIAESIRMRPDPVNDFLNSLEK